MINKFMNKKEIEEELPETRASNETTVANESLVITAVGTTDVLAEASSVNGASSIAVSSVLTGNTGVLTFTVTTPVTLTSSTTVTTADPAVTEIAPAV